MAKKKLVYLVCDTETATLPFADRIANGDEEAKKRIAIARPLVYDIGWTLMHRDGTIIKRAQYLVQETFFVPQVFNTAYYKDKRPLYIAMLEKGEISANTWRRIMAEFVEDCKTADFVGAFNAMFDFKKAIPFTELYISKLYGADYIEWERMQYRLCTDIANNRTKKTERDFDPMNFNFRGEDYPLFDLWGMSVNTLLNSFSYRNACLDNGMITASGEYFKTSAESSYRYIKDMYDFNEAHTALADAEIESYLLKKILRKKAVTQGIEYFPFRNLGYTDEFIFDMFKKGKAKPEQIRLVLETMKSKIDSYESGNAYRARLEGKIEVLTQWLGIVLANQQTKKNKKKKKG